MQDEEFLLPPGGLKAGREGGFQAAQPFLLVVVVVIISTHFFAFKFLCLGETQKNDFAFLKHLS